MTISPTTDPASEATPSRPGRRPSAVISVSWSGLAYGAGALALASTSALAIVATISHADALATIALALAILSFIIQIGLFIAQSWTSGQQVLHSEELNSDTRTILAEVRENARGTNQLISDQFERVLTHLLETTKRTVNESIKGPDARILNERLDRELRRTLSRQVDAVLKPRQLNSVEREHYRTLRTYPSTAESLAESEAAISGVSPAATVDLGRLGEDEITTLRPGSTYSRGLFESLVPHVDELVAAGLAKSVEAPQGWDQYAGQSYYVLTDRGRQAARLITGQKVTQEEHPAEIAQAPSGDGDNSGRLEIGGTG